NPREPRVVCRLRLSAESSSTISNLPSISCLLAKPGECQETSCALRWIAFNPHSAVMGFGNSFGYRQPDAGSGCFKLRTRRAVKALKDPHSLLRGDKGACI